MQDARRGNQVCFSYLKAKVILGDENDSDKMVACILHPASCIRFCYNPAPKIFKPLHITYLRELTS
jgi:hypothetical protein